MPDEKSIPIPSITYPGIKQIVGGSITVSHGITPSVATVQVAPQKELVDSVGLLKFEYDGKSIEFPDAKLDRATFQYDLSGQVVGCQILDRRWKWRFGEISGHFNPRTPGGQLDGRWKERLRTPRELAVICLLAMGERDYDLSGMPDNTAPEVNWQNDNPAQCLADLCDTLGCRIVLRMSNTVAICQAGVGADLEVDNTVLPPYVEPMVAPRRPDVIKIVCGKTRFQLDWVLTPVGLDVDGRVKAIGDLSYKPAAGWNQQPPFFGGVSDQPVPLFAVQKDDAIKSARDLAQKTVFKWYGMAWQNRGKKVGGLSAPIFGDITYGDQVEWEDDQALEFPRAALISRFNGLFGKALAAKPVNNAPENKPWGIGEITQPTYFKAQVLGLWYDGRRTEGGDPNFTVDTEYNRPFTIRKDLPIVEFSERVLRWYPPNFPTPYNQAAVLYLRTAATIRFLKDGSYHRAFKEAVAKNIQVTGARIIKHEEISLSVIVTYDAKGNESGVITNEKDVLEQCDYYLAAAEKEYQDAAIREITYAGLRYVTLDGAIQQVTWTIGLSGVTTRISRNNEFSTTVPSYRERRFFEKLKVDTIDQLRDDVKRLKA